MKYSTLLGIILGFFFLPIQWVFAQPNVLELDPKIPLDSYPGLEFTPGISDSFWESFTQSINQCSLSPRLLQKKNRATLMEQGIITPENVSQADLTLPSLWWTSEQYGEGKLLQDWFAFPHLKRIDLVVNRQLWFEMNYLEQYRFVNRFGTVARQYGYELRVFNSEPTCLAVYSCDYSPFPDPPACTVDLQPMKRDPFNL